MKYKIILIIKKGVEILVTMSLKHRFGHRVLSHSKRSVLSRSFFEFLATYETQKNGTFFPILFKRTGKNAKIVPFFYKERERTRERSVLLEKNTERSVLFSIYIYKYILNKYILKKERNVLF